MSYEDLILPTAEELATKRLRPPVEGYPPLSDKLTFSSEEWEAMVQSGRFDIAEGPWSVNEHPNRLKPERGSIIDPIATVANPMSPERIHHWHCLGLKTDTAGRPLHPLAGTFLTAPEVGMYTGPGFNYGYGPQLIGNLAARKVEEGVVKYAAIAVLRGAGLVWSLPGGYGKPGESARKIPFREGREEGGFINLSKLRRMGHLSIDTCMAPIGGFGRNTLHSWLEEHFTFVMSETNPSLRGMRLKIRDKREVKKLAWLRLDSILRRPDFIDGHREEIVRYEARLKQRTIAADA